VDTWRGLIDIFASVHPSRETSAEPSRWSLRAVVSHRGSRRGLLLARESGEVPDRCLILHLIFALAIAGVKAGTIIASGREPRHSATATRPRHGRVCAHLLLYIRND